MIARLAAVLALVVVGLVLPVAPAAASCAVDASTALGENPDFAFVGVDQRRVKDGDRLIVRFRVERAYLGDLNRTQDVLVPDDGTTSSGADWSTGDRVLVVGRWNEVEQATTSYCTTGVEGSPEYDAALAQLGEGKDPMPGVDRIEPEGLSRRDLLWVRLVVGVVGLTALGVLAARWVRSRRTA